MGEFNNQKEKIINILYLERSGEIYEENYNDEYKVMERDKSRLEKMILDFLKENLSETKFENVRSYLDNLDEKNVSINTILNRRFYEAGFCDGIKLT